VSRALGPLYIITDGDNVADVGRVLAELPPGAALVQLREKTLSANELLSRAEALRALTRTRGVPLLINDRLDVALLCEADGVHLPEAGLDVRAARRLASRGDFLIGKSTHSVDAVRAASEAGADLIVFGPIFETPGKRALGIDALMAATAQAHRPVFAIGGFQSETQVRAARAAGAHGVAAIRAFTGANGPRLALEFARILVA
jgi:thiamine-phosphate pyrophosphorylase